jgi:ATP-binding cassette, subfamily C, bacterial
MKIMHFIPGYGLIHEAFCAYPQRSVLIVALMLLSGLAEGVGIATVLPVLSIAVGDGNAMETELGQIILDYLGGVGLSTDLVTLLIVMVIGLSLKAVLVLLAMQQIGFASVHISTDLRFALIRSLMKARWSYYASQPVGTFANAMSVEATQGGATFTGAYTILAVTIQIAVYLGLAMLVSWQVTVASLVAGTVMMIILGRFIEMTRRASQHASQAFNDLLRQLTDVLTGIKPLKAMAVEERVGPLLEAEALKINLALRRVTIAKECMQWLREPILVIFLAVGLYVALAVWKTSFEVVLVMALLFYRTVNNIARLQSAYQQLAASNAYYQRIREKIRTAIGEKEAFTGRRAPVLSQAVRLDHVSLSLGGKPVLVDVSATISVGQITTLFGPSGAGKTTLADLLVGLYSPDKGRVLVDDIPLSDIEIDSWRREIGYVPQEMFLFHDTLLNNITLGDPELTIADAEASLRAAGAWDFVSSLPDTVHTVVGERGSRISGGQRQRVAIARALVRKPKLLILDEPTTALDPDTERAICSTLKNLSHQTTILAISHQQALVDAADIVYRIGDGKVTLETSRGDVRPQTRESSSYGHIPTGNPSVEVEDSSCLP